MYARGKYKALILEMKKAYNGESKTKLKDDYRIKIKIKKKT